MLSNLPIISVAGEKTRRARLGFVRLSLSWDMRRCLFAFVTFGLVACFGMQAKHAYAAASVTQVGSSTGYFAEPYTVPLSSSVPQGAGIVVVLGQNTLIGNYNVTSTDTESNTYQTDQQQVQAADSDGTVTILSARATHALTAASDTITIAVPAGADGATAIVVYAVSPFASVSWLDRAVGTSTIGDSPATLSLTPGQ